MTYIVKAVVCDPLNDGGNVVVVGQFYIALFSALEQTHCTRL